MVLFKGCFALLCFDLIKSIALIDLIKSNQSIDLICF